MGPKVSGESTVSTPQSVVKLATRIAPMHMSSFVPSESVTPQMPARLTRQESWNPEDTTGGDENRDGVGGWWKRGTQGFGGPGGGDGSGGSPHGSGSDVGLYNIGHPRPDGGKLRMKLDPPEMFDGRSTPFVRPRLIVVHCWAWLTGIP